TVDAPSFKFDRTLRPGIGHRSPPRFPYSRDPTFHRVLTLNACNTRNFSLTRPSFFMTHPNFRWRINVCPPRRSSLHAGHTLTLLQLLLLLPSVFARHRDATAQFW